MTSLGGGLALLCMAVLGLVMSERPWVRILCGLSVGFCAVAVAAQVGSGGWDPWVLILSLLMVLLGMYLHAVEHMFDPRKRKEKRRRRQGERPPG